MTDFSENMRARRKRRHRGRIGSSQGVPRSGNYRVELDDAVEDATLTGLPQMVLLAGETGRGKSFAIQTFYDSLASGSPGYWKPGLQPHWPPRSVAAMRAERKRVKPGEELRNREADLDFLWAAVSCSGHADAPRLDPTADFLRQIHDLIQDCVIADATSKSRRSWIAKKLVEGVTQLEPTLNTLEFLLSTAFEATSQLGNAPKSTLERERFEIHEVLVQFAALYRALEVPAPPAVIVIDDASGAPPDLFSAASCFVGNPALTTTTGRRFLPATLDEFPPLPVVFVFTTWTHALVDDEEQRNPLVEWIREWKDLGLGFTQVPFSSFSASQAVALVRQLPDRSEGTIRELAVERIAKSGPSGSVNQLVLSEHIAWIEEQRDPLSGGLRVEAPDLELLSTSPLHHLNERLEKLREEEPRGVLLLVLRLLAEFGPQFRFVNLESLAARAELTLSAEDLLRRLANTGAVVALDDNLPLESIGFDADMRQVLITRKLDATHTKLLSEAAADSFVAWASGLEARSGNDLMESWNSRRASFEQCARLGVNVIRADHPELAPLAELFANHPEITSFASLDDAGIALAWAESGHERGFKTDAILRGTIELGICPASVFALEKLALLRSLKSSADLARDAIAMLRPSIGTRNVGDIYSRLAVNAGLYAEVLEGKEQLPDQVAVAVATKMAREGRVKDAVALLEGRENPNAVVKHALLVKGSRGLDYSIKLLSGRLNEWSVARPYFELLVDDGRTAEAMLGLKPWVETRAAAASLYAKLALAADDTEGARSALVEWQPISVSAAIDLASLEWTEGRISEAFAALAPYLSTNQAAAQWILARLNEVADERRQFALVGNLIRERQIRERQETEGAPNERVVADKQLIRKQAISAVDREDVASAIADLGSSSPREVADHWLKLIATTDVELRALSLALQSEFESSGDLRISELVLWLLLSIRHPSVAIACTIADYAFTARVDNAENIARYALEIHERPRTESAVAGRLVALAALKGLCSADIRKLSRLRFEDRPYAFLAMFRMLGRQPELELQLWTNLLRSITNREDQDVWKICAVIAASRVMAIRRAMSDPPSIRHLAMGLFEEETQERVVGLLRAVLFGYAENPEKIRPKLLTYQALSVHEIHSAISTPYARLDNAFAERFRTQIAVAPEDVSRSLLEWAEFSPWLEALLAGDGGPRG